MRCNRSIELRSWSGLVAGCLVCNNISLTKRAVRLSYIFIKYQSMCKSTSSHERTYYRSLPIADTDIYYITRLFAFINDEIWKKKRFEKYVCFITIAIQYTWSGDNIIRHNLLGTYTRYNLIDGVIFIIFFSYEPSSSIWYFFIYMNYR